MPFLLALLFSSFWLTSPAGADTLRVSTADVPEVRSISKLLKEVYREIGHEIELVVRPAKRSLMEVNAGTSDAELARIIGTENEYPNLVRVKEPVYALSVSAIVVKTSRHWMSSWEKIAKLRVGYPRGYRLLDVRTRDMNAVKVRDPKAVVRMVKGARFDVGLLITSDALRLAAADDGLTVLDPPIETLTLYHYLHVKHRRLVPAIEEVLIRLNDSGRAKEILRARD